MQVIFLQVLLPETVELINGQRITGSIIKESAEEVVVRSGNRYTRIPLKAVSKIYRKGEKVPPAVKGQTTYRAGQKLEAAPPQPYPTISVELEEKLSGVESEILRGADAAERKARHGAQPQADRDRLFPLEAMERWLALPRRYPDASGRVIEVDWPWKGQNARAIAFLGIPASYDPLAGPWPLVIALHGTEDHPGNMSSVMSGVLAAGCFLMAPRTTSAHFWDHPEEIRNLVRGVGHLADHYRIDPRRLVLCGGSGGGMGTWSIAGRHPELFCAAGSFAGMPGIPVSWVKRLKFVPFYILHGRSDHIPIEGPRKMKAELERLGYEHVYVEYDGDHFPPESEKAKFREWLERAPKKQDASPRPALLEFMREAATAIPFSGTEWNFGPAGAMRK